jgi:tetratricopeptide (TPR) repeat protein
MKKSIPRPGSLSENPMLSVCMIVRDEEKTLKRCLDSVRGVADELVVVDTGSKDGTVSVAQDFGAKLYHFTWCDDFSAARNESIKYATGDWIFIIDADEELLSDSIEPLRECMNNPWCLLYTVTVDNGPNYPDRFFHPGRLFRNHPEMRYSRAYHETLRDGERMLREADPRWQIAPQPRIILRHDGYDESYMKEKDKYSREIRILESHLRNNLNDFDMAIRLAEIFTCVEECDKAMTICRKVIAANPDFARAHHALGAAYWKKERFDEAIVEFKKTLRVDPGFSFARYRLGVAYCTKGMFGEAIGQLEEALKMEFHFPLAHCWLGITYCKAGMLEDGIRKLVGSVNMDPNLALAHYWLGAAYNKQGLFEDAISAFTQAEAIDPAVAEHLPLNLATAHFNLGTLLHSKGRIDEAIQEFKKTLALNPNDAEAHYGLCVTYSLEKQHMLAIKHCDEAIKLGLDVDPRLLEELEPHRGVSKR